ncbi:hypothetical protein QTH91_16515 [Variovorax dokdonensis]|uniref:Uncharacterized protein n=1 Tax=Variovorax dokdonensis TaxID=344883 RepID=A0ABT7NDR6_9BURK|nr:hypothetical protein [Variovorax dokdonensis]MDM0046095.1 hypothetical protein [Variovorax dokdonensis]
MQPHLDIRRIAPDFFTYSVHAGAAPTSFTEDSTDSLAGCLGDAGDSLVGYFPEVRVSIDGQVLGSYAVARLMNNPVDLAAELMMKKRS